MFLRRHRKWGEDGLTTMTASAVAPGAHDLLSDASRNSATQAGRGLSVSLQVTASDLSVEREEPGVAIAEHRDVMSY